MRYRLLASASLAALGLACALPAIPQLATPALAADCGCRDAVRAALAHQAPVVKKAAAAKIAVRKVPARRMAAAAPAFHGEISYDYRSAGLVDNRPYTHHWEVAPQGYVPPPVAMAAPPMNDQGDYQGDEQVGLDMPPLPPSMAMAAPPPGAPPAYGEGYQDGYAYGYQAGITIEQGGWAGGVGYARTGGGGGGGEVLTLAQPDSHNGPNYNSFGESYGGDYQSANQVNAWRTQAFTPPASSGSSSGSGH